MTYKCNREKYYFTFYFKNNFFKSNLVFHLNFAKTPNALLYFKYCNFVFPIWILRRFLPGRGNSIPHIRCAFCVIRLNTTIRNYSLYIYQTCTIRTAAVCVCVGLSWKKSDKNVFFFVIYFSCYYYIRSHESFTRNTCAL